MLFTKLIWIFLFSIVTLADPGGWVSSGGEIFENGKNPWFVKNTTQVTYCLQFSKDEFSIAEADVAKLIQESIGYWKNEFNGESAIGIDIPKDPLFNQVVQVANQEFVQNPSCTNDEDITFKFGSQFLDPDEIKLMKDPTRFVGVSIRKSYDPVNLKGRGIIYISGDQGEKSYKKINADIVPRAWQYPKLLKYALIHELGHVFGIPHAGSGLMSEVFLDQLLIRKFAALYVREPIMPFIKPISRAEICDVSVVPKGSQSFLAPYFSLVYKQDCLKLELVPNQREFMILTKKQTEKDWRQIGVLVIDQREFVDFSLKPALVFQVPEEQKVFQNITTTFLLGPLIQNYKVDGHINFGTGTLKPYPVQIDLSPDSIVVYGLYENRIRQIFSFGNPLLFSLSNPF